MQRYYENQKPKSERARYDQKKVVSACDNTLSLCPKSMITASKNG